MDWTNAQIQQIVTTLQSQVAALTTANVTLANKISSLQIALNAIPAPTAATSQKVVTDGSIIQSLKWVFQALVTFATATFGGTVTLSALTASKPLHTDGSKNIVSAAINLTTDVSGDLPIANGGTGAGTASAARIALNAANATTYAGTITGTANLITGAVTGTCSVTIIP